MERVTITKFKNGKYNIGFVDEDGELTGETYQNFQEMERAIKERFQEAVKEFEKTEIK